MSSQIRSSRRMAEQLDLTRSTRHLCCIFNMSSRGGAQLASDVLKGYIIFREGSRTAFVATSLELVALDTQNVLEESVVASA